MAEEWLSMESSISKNEGEEKDGEIFVTRCPCDGDFLCLTREFVHGATNKVIQRIRRFKDNEGELVSTTAISEVLLALPSSLIRSPHPLHELASLHPVRIVDFLYSSYHRYIILCLGLMKVQPTSICHIGVGGRLFAGVLA